MASPISAALQLLLSHVHLCPPSLPCAPACVCCSGIRHGIDMERLLDASDYISRALGGGEPGGRRKNNSRAAEALLKRRQSSAGVGAAAT